LLHAFSAELLTVLSCDNFVNPDISQKFFLSIWILKKYQIRGLTMQYLHRNCHRTERTLGLAGFHPTQRTQRNNKHRLRFSVASLASAASLAFVAFFLAFS